jgi:hypothetical protein
MGVITEMSNRGDAPRKTDGIEALCAQIPEGKREAAKLALSEIKNPSKRDEVLKITQLCLKLYPDCKDLANSIKSLADASDAEIKEARTYLTEARKFEELSHNPLIKKTTNLWEKLLLRKAVEKLDDPSYVSQQTASLHTGTMSIKDTIEVLNIIDQFPVEEKWFICRFITHQLLGGKTDTDLGKEALDLIVALPDEKRMNFCNFTSELITHRMDIEERSEILKAAATFDPVHLVPELQSEIKSLLTEEMTPKGIASMLTTFAKISKDIGVKAVLNIIEKNRKSILGATTVEDKVRILNDAADLIQKKNSAR